MTSLAEVRLWGRTIGAVALADGEQTASFEYAPEFVGSGIEVAPRMMPLSHRVYRFPELAPQTFHGLPGLLADSLPDRFGNALIDAWLATQGRRADSFNAVERLSYIGNRGMGALEFVPVLGPRARDSDRVEVDELVRLASRVLSHRSGLEVSFAAEQKSESLKHILQVGTSAGGARAKAVIAWHPQTGEVRSGQIDAGEGFEYWLLKFDGVSGNRDKEMEDPQGYGVIEYAYHQMATDAGIDMMPCRLLEENGRRHFMTRRFDRTASGDKLHMQSLCAMAHYDFNMAGAYSYEQAFMVMRELGLPREDIEQQFLRMVFNIVARNQDDHVKNIAFLMDRRGNWRLSPAFDVTYAWQPTGLWTSRHQMSMNGKRDNFTLEDFRACGRAALLRRGQAEDMLERVRKVVRRWPDYAASAALPAAQSKAIAEGHRSGAFS